MFRREINLTELALLGGAALFRKLAQSGERTFGSRYERNRHNTAPPR